MKRILPLLLAGVAAAHALHAQTAATTERATPDYQWLSLQTLPPPGPVVDAAVAALPSQLKQKQDWLKRMHRSAWMPSLGLRYSVGEAFYRPYTVVDRQVLTTGSDRSQESASSTSQSVGESANNGTQVAVASDSSQRSGSSSFSQTEFYGPDSYARSEDTRWINEYGVDLTWDLSKLIFRAEEIAVTGAEINRAAFERELRAQVIQTYYDLKEALMLLQTDTYKDSVPTRIRKERLAFQLDSLTEGAFSIQAQRPAP